MPAQAHADSIDRVGLRRSPLAEMKPIAARPTLQKLATGHYLMKLIVAVIQPTKLKAVREALVKMEVTRMTVTDAQGYARQRGQTEMYRGSEYKVQLLRKVAVEIVVNDDFLDRTLKTLEAVARTGPEGTVGDGKIFVLPCERMIRLSDGLEGPEAV